MNTKINLVGQSFAIVLVGLIFLVSSAGAIANPKDKRARLNERGVESVNESDVSAEIIFGKNVASRILGREKIIPLSALNRYVSLVGAALVAHSSRNELNYHFTVLDSDRVNAYSAPGGYVFLTRGAVLAVQNEDELAGILAHEIGHISQRHIVKELNLRGTDGLGISSMSRFLGSSADTARAALDQTLDKAMSILYDTGFREEQELDADSVATLLLAETGYDPTALHRFLANVDSSNIQSAKKSIEMRTHPASKKRLSALSQLIDREKLVAIPHPTMKTRFDGHVQTISRASQ